jgi:hypothetical protein
MALNGRVQAIEAAEATPAAPAHAPVRWGQAPNGPTPVKRKHSYGSLDQASPGQGAGDP